MAVDEEVANAINGLWILVAGILCFLLQAGFGLLEAGGVRAMNAQNIMLKNLLDACVAALSYWAVGYAFAYGDTGNPFIGGRFFFLIDFDDYIGWFFQYVFAGTTATIVSGAVAERCRFRAYLIYSCVLTAFIYPVVSHWIWSGDGWLTNKALDFAGGAAVHGVGGAAALSGAYFLGPRLGRFVYHADTGRWESVPIPGHNYVIAALGTFILWMGFFPFNGGSGLNIVGDGQLLTGRVVVVTTLSGATGACTMLAFGKWKTGNYDLMLSVNGLLAGMIATCSGVNVVQPWVALILGSTGSLVAYGQSWAQDRFRIDDPLGAAPLHMGAGFWGTLMAGFFAHPDLAPGQVGAFYGGGGTQLGWQIVCILADFTWAFGTCSIMFFTLNKFNLFRVSEDTERAGMDIMHHGGKAYTMNDIEQQEKKTVKMESDEDLESFTAEETAEGLRRRKTPTAIQHGAE